MPPDTQLALAVASRIAETFGPALGLSLLVWIAWTLRLRGPQRPERPQHGELTGRSCPRCGRTTRTDGHTDWCEARRTCGYHEATEPPTTTRP